jgi:hypothetical protein
MTVICIHQPDFLPWLGFFERLKRCDIFVVLDNVQFLRRGWQNRDLIKTHTGQVWMTVPVRKKGRYHQLIREVEIDDSHDWRRKHLTTLRSAYGGTPHFKNVFESISEIYGRQQKLLIELNMDLIGYLGDMLGISVRTIRSSDLNVDSESSALLVGITKHLGGHTYLTGTGARQYLDEKEFEASGINVEWQDFTHPVYEQAHGEFVPNLSSIDCLFNCGPECRSLISDDIVR